MLSLVTYMKQNRIRIGIIGTGPAGKSHLDIWKNIDNIDLVGFYEPDDDTANSVTEKYQVPRFLHPEILLESCDAVDIATGPEGRFGWCEKAIKKGKHVFVESPMAQTLKEARQLLMLIEESGIKFQVQAADRFNPAITAANILPSMPSFLELSVQFAFTEANFKKDITHGFLINSIGLVQAIVRSDIKTVLANTVQVLSEDNDIINIRLEFHNGCVAGIVLNRVSVNNAKTIRLFYKDMMVNVDLLQKKAALIKIKELKDPAIFAFDIETASGSKTIITEDLYVPETNELKTELEEFRDAILYNTKTVNSETDGWIAMDIARQVIEKTGHTIFAR